MKQKYTTQRKPSAIEALINTDPSKISAPALKTALEKHQAAEAEKEAEKALAAFSYATRLQELLLTTVRNLRQQEKAALAKLKEFSDAVDAFKQDGDISKLNDAMYKARGY